MWNSRVICEGREWKGREGKQRRDDGVEEKNYQSPGLGVVADDYLSSVFYARKTFDRSGLTNVCRRRKREYERPARGGRIVYHRIIVRVMQWAL